MARFVVCDPEQRPASELLAEMAEELNELYGTPSRLDHPAVLPSDLRAPGGTFLVGWEGQAAVAGGGVRRFGDGVGEIKRMFVRPAARSRGIAGEMLTALECAARTLGYRSVRLDTGPKQPHAESLYRRTGFVPIAAYNDNPFASFWGEKALDLPPAVNAGAPPWTTQSGFDVRLCWGPAGVRALGGEVRVVVLVDILRFTTALDVAVGAGAQVFPHPWPIGSLRTDAYPPGAEVADGTGPRHLSLSPAGLARVRPGDRIVLPSANGSHCSTLAAGMGAAVVGASLRNAGAVARWLLRTTAGRPVGPIAIVPCGERWPDDSLRPAVEDLIGAGALVAALIDGDADRSRSPEAGAAMAAFDSVQGDLSGALVASASGRELHAKGSGDDVGWAAALNVSSCVPVLGADGAYVAASDVP